MTFLKRWDFFLILLCIFLYDLKLRLPIDENLISRNCFFAEIVCGAYFVIKYEAKNFKSKLGVLLVLLKYRKINLLL